MGYLNQTEVLALWDFQSRTGAPPAHRAVSEASMPPRADTLCHERMHVRAGGALATCPPRSPSPQPHPPNPQKPRRRAPAGARSVKFGAWPTNVGFAPNIGACGSAEAPMTFTAAAPVGTSGVVTSSTASLPSAGLYRCALPVPLGVDPPRHNHARTPSCQAPAGLQRELHCCDALLHTRAQSIDAHPQCPFPPGPPRRPQGARGMPACRCRRARSGRPTLPPPACTRPATPRPS